MLYNSFLQGYIMFMLVRQEELQKENELITHMKQDDLLGKHYGAINQLI